MNNHDIWHTFNSTSDFISGSLELQVIQLLPGKLIDQQRQQSNQNRRMKSFQTFCMDSSFDQKNKGKGGKIGWAGKFY